MSLANFAGGRAAMRTRHQADARRETRKKLSDAVNQSTAERREAYAESLEPMDYLQRLGYDKDSSALPLKVVVEGHQEESKCTMYELRCTLGAKGETGYTAWRCRKRLCTLREDLHDPIKEALGPVYTALRGDAIRKTWRASWNNRTLGGLVWDVGGVDQRWLRCAAPRRLGASNPQRSSPSLNES